jgi:trans-aconitate methyltransferase
MQKSMEDKLFFLDSIKDAEYFVDYGCADGTLMELTKEHIPDIKLHGIDMSEEMINRAKQKLPDATFTCSNMPYIGREFEYDKAALNLSSVLHEVYSYSTKEQIEEFWKYVNNCGYKYIIIRDMVSNIDYADAKESDVEKVRNNKQYESKLKEFEDIWGTIDNQRNLIHFLLKYRYNVNWNREVRENYIPLTDVGLLEELDLYRYDAVYSDEFTLPFLKDTIKKDFDIDIEDVTHIKLVLKKIEE